MCYFTKKKKNLAGHNFCLGKNQFCSKSFPKLKLKIHLPVFWVGEEQHPEGLSIQQVLWCAFLNPLFKLHLKGGWGKANKKITQKKKKQTTKLVSDRGPSAINRQLFFLLTGVEISPECTALPFFICLSS